MVRSSIGNHEILLETNHNEAMNILDIEHEYWNNTDHSSP